MFYPNETVGTAICIAGILLCLILGLFLLSGRGFSMIAGFNTASREKQGTVKQTVLCRAVGLFVLYIGAVIGAIIPAALHSVAWLVYLLIGLMLVSAVCFLIYINRSRRFIK